MKKADEPDDRPSFGQARRTKKEDYTKNIMNSFVSGGTKAGSKPPAPKEEYDRDWFILIERFTVKWHFSRHREN